MPSETIPALLACHAELRPTQDAVVDPYGRLTWAELDRRSSARSAWLVAQGVNKGHRTGLLMANGVEWIVNACAIMRVGAVLVPLSTHLSQSELASQISIGALRHLILAKEVTGRQIPCPNLSAFPSLVHMWRQGELGDKTDSTAAELATALEQRVTRADDMAVIFTSGSSGNPKGVIHVHGAAIRATRAGLDCRCIRQDSRLYLPMPLFWTGGFSGGLVSALVSGATLLTEERGDPAATLAFLASERVTLYRGWPDQAVRLAAHPHFAKTDLSALQPGSLDAVMPRDRQAPIGARANLFGMTETFGPWCGYPLDQVLPEGKHGSCGKPFEGVKVRIVDPVTETMLPLETEGRIQLGGRNLLRGVCGREREEVFTPDGWFESGDCGRIDADGFIWFSGRADDMIKISGASVYPAEVERALTETGGATQAFAAGVERAGRTVLSVALALEAGDERNSTDFAAWANERLSGFKVPKLWLLFPAGRELPRLPNGKVDRSALRIRLSQDARETGT